MAPAIRDRRLRTRATVRQLRDNACCRIARNKLRVLHWPGDVCKYSMAVVQYPTTAKQKTTPHLCHCTSNNNFNVNCIRR